MVHQFHWPRPAAAAVLAALIPVVSMLPALATLGIVTAVMVALIGYETRAYADVRERVRHDPAHEE